jgi:hypothetical protein
VVDAAQRLVFTAFEREYAYSRENADRDWEEVPDLPDVGQEPPADVIAAFARRDPSAVEPRPGVAGAVLVDAR